jgi:hypothetical protein
VFHSETLHSEHLDFSGCQHKQLLGAQRVRPGCRLLLSQLLQQPRRFGMHACSPVQLYRGGQLVECQQLLRSLRQQRVDLRLIVILRDFHSKAPMVQAETRLHRQGNVPCLQKREHGVVSKADALEGSA